MGAPHADDLRKISVQGMNGVSPNALGPCVLNRHRALRMLVKTFEMLFMLFMLFTLFMLFMQ